MDHAGDDTVARTVVPELGLAASGQEAVRFATRRCQRMRRSIVIERAHVSRHIALKKKKVSLCLAIVPTGHTRPARRPAR